MRYNSEYRNGDILTPTLDQMRMGSRIDNNPPQTERPVGEIGRCLDELESQIIHLNNLLDHFFTRIDPILNNDMTPCTPDNHEKEPRSHSSNIGERLHSMTNKINITCSILSRISDRIAL